MGTSFSIINPLLTALTIASITNVYGQYCTRRVEEKVKGEDLCDTYVDDCPHCIVIPECEWRGEITEDCLSKSQSISLSKSMAPKISYEETDRYFVWIRETSKKESTVTYVGSSEWKTKVPKSRAKKTKENAVKEPLHFDLYSGLCEYATYDPKTHEYICQYNKEFMPPPYLKPDPPMEIRFKLTSIAEFGWDGWMFADLFEYKLHTTKLKRTKVYKQYRKISNVNIYYTRILKSEIQPLIFVVPDEKPENYDEKTSKKKKTSDSKPDPWPFYPHFEVYQSISFQIDFVEDIHIWEEYLNTYYLLKHGMDVMKISTFESKGKVVDWSTYNGIILYSKWLEFDVVLKHPQIHANNIKFLFKNTIDGKAATSKTLWDVDVDAYAQLVQECMPYKKMGQPLETAYSILKENEFVVPQIEWTPKGDNDDSWDQTQIKGKLNALTEEFQNDEIYGQAIPYYGTFKFINKELNVELYIFGVPTHGAAESKKLELTKRIDEIDPDVIILEAPTKNFISGLTKIKEIIEKERKKIGTGEKWKISAYQEVTEKWKGKPITEDMIKDFYYEALVSAYNDGLYAWNKYKNDPHKVIIAADIPHLPRKLLWFLTNKVQSAYLGATNPYLYWGTLLNARNHLITAVTNAAAIKYGPLRGYSKYFLIIGGGHIGISQDAQALKEFPWKHVNGYFLPELFTTEYKSLKQVINEPTMGGGKFITIDYSLPPYTRTERSIVKGYLDYNNDNPLYNTPMIRQTLNIDWILINCVLILCGLLLYILYCIFGFVVCLLCGILGYSYKSSQTKARKALYRENSVLSEDVV